MAASHTGSELESYELPIGDVEEMKQWQYSQCSPFAHKKYVFVLCGHGQIAIVQRGRWCGRRSRVQAQELESGQINHVCTLDQVLC